MTSDAPAEKRWRPAINVAMRSAAASRDDSRVIGVQLTGRLDDGALGMQAIHRCGGTALVQDPNEAEFPEMSQSALSRVFNANSLPLAQMAKSLTQLAGSSVERHGVPSDIAVEAGLHGPCDNNAELIRRASEHAVNQLPAIGGTSHADREALGDAQALGRTYENASPFRCDETVQQSMLAALHALEDQAAALERLATQSELRGSSGPLSEDLRQRAEEAREQAAQFRTFLHDLRLSTQL